MAELAEEEEEEEPDLLEDELLLLLLLPLLLLEPELALPITVSGAMTEAVGEGVTAVAAVLDSVLVLDLLLLWPGWCFLASVGPANDPAAQHTVGRGMQSDWSHPPKTTMPQS